MTEVIVWTGWVGGIGIGVYALVQHWLTNQHLGVSTSFSAICTDVLKIRTFAKASVKAGGSWRLWFIIGIPLGALVAALTSPGPIEASFSLGALYDAVLPASFALKALVLTLGGVLIGLGSRMSGGCTSGHSIAGIGMLNPPSILASVGFFAGGIIIVNLLFHVFN